MNERYLYQAMRGEERPDVDAMAAVLTRIWRATLYGTQLGEGVPPHV